MFGVIHGHKIRLLNPSWDFLPLQKHFGAASRWEEQEPLLLLHDQLLKNQIIYLMDPFIWYLALLC